MKAWIYARAGGYSRLSFDAQRVRAMKHLESLSPGLPADVAIEVVEEVASGRTSAGFARPNLDRLLQTVEPGDLVVVWRLDRLARSLNVAAGILARLRAAGAQLVVVDLPAGHDVNELSEGLLKLASLLVDHDK